MKVEKMKEILINKFKKFEYLVKKSSMLDKKSFKANFEHFIF